MPVSKRTCPSCGGRKDFYAATCRRCQPKPVGLTGRTGDAHPSWKGGRFVNDEGYVMVLATDHPWRRASRYMPEHIIVAELRMGRRLRPNEVVHHVDHDRQNNAPSNLVVKDRGRHSSEHRREDSHLRRRVQGRFA